MSEKCIQTTIPTTYSGIYTELCSASGLSGDSDSLDAFNHYINFNNVNLQSTSRPP